ncbi:sarcosine oxidase [Xylaria arbuscula]|nr:sarcosine oxidase [Xylaria arbuscula]
MADYIVVGAGVFGVSTALHLAISEPNAIVYLVDRTQCPNPSAASSDLNKIVRADYDDIFYMRLALEALHEWNTNPLYKPFFHETGMLVADEINMGNASFHNYKKLNINPEAEISMPSQALEKFPIFRNANWTGVKDTYYNPRSGWSEAEPAIKAVAVAALNAGVKFLQQEVDVLSFDDQGACIGIKKNDGDEIQAKNTLLCTGAWTAQLLADSSPHNYDLQVNGRMIAAAASQCIVQCDPDYLDLYRDAPVHLLGMYHTRGKFRSQLDAWESADISKGDSIPPTSDGRLKLNFAASFTNKNHHKAFGQTISTPPSRESLSTWSHDVPEELKEKLRKVIEHVYGKNAPGLTVQSYRMCWDAITPNQDWIISPHPACKGLNIAGGGSFHAWKFLPVLGKYVSQMLKDELTPEQAKKWSWDRNNDGAACVMYMPQNDLKDFS